VASSTAIVAVLGALSLTHVPSFLLAITAVNLATAVYMQLRRVCADLGWTMAALHRLLPSSPG
jgi:hypothetical protein